MNNAKKVKVRVDAGKITGDLLHNWRYIGYDECNYTHTPEGKELIGKFGKLEDAPYYIRTHHLFCTGNCHGRYKWGSTNVYTEDDKGNPVYDWKVLDEINDIIINNNCKPFFELGFMPLDLADPSYSTSEYSWAKYGEYQRTGWSYPPKDYNKWYDLIYNVVKHCVDRYGRDEVLTWYWELWNEPDITYWRGTLDEFLKLYDYTEAAVHAALPEARLGGPATTGPLPGSKSLDYLEKFLDHCRNGINYYSGKKGTRLDYVTFHVKGGGFTFKINAPKETPSVKHFVEQVECGLDAVKKYGYEDLEIVLSEADPDGWAAGGRFDNTNMNFRNTEYYATYVASSYNKIFEIARERNMDVRPLAWAFLFPGERCFEGTRTFTTQGIDKPVFNLFRMYAKLGNKSLPFESSQKKDVRLFKDKFGTGEEPELDGIATVSDDGSIRILLYSHHDDWDVKAKFDVEVVVENLPFHEAAIRQYYLDATHSNAYAEWVNQGMPDWPSKEQYDAIKSRDDLELIEPLQAEQTPDGKVIIKCSHEAHAVSLIMIEKKE